MSVSNPDTIDPKGLIREAYRIEGITEGECRSIFLDWALALPDGMDAPKFIPTLLERYGQADHPMTTVLQDGMAHTATPRRRGGWRSRPRD